MCRENNSYSDDIKKTLNLYLSISEGILKGWGLILSTITLHASFIDTNYGILNELISESQITYLMRYWIPLFFWGMSIIFSVLYVRGIVLKTINTNNLMTLIAPTLFFLILLITGILNTIIINYYFL